MNKYAEDAAEDEPTEGGAGTGHDGGTRDEARTANHGGTGSQAESGDRARTGDEAGTGDERQDAVSVEAGVSRHEVPDAPTTGESAVDDALARLSQISETPTSDHVEIYDDVHRRLTDALADVDED